MTEEKRWIKNPDFRLEELDGEAILYNSAAAKVMSLNQTSFLIWEMCNGDCTTEDHYQGPVQRISRIGRSHSRGCGAGHPPSFRAPSHKIDMCQTLVTQISFACSRVGLEMQGPEAIALGRFLFSGWPQAEWAGRCAPSLDSIPGGL